MKSAAVVPQKGWL